MWLAVRARDDRAGTADFASARRAARRYRAQPPGFVLFPFALAGIGVIVLPPFGVHAGRARSGWCVMLAVFCADDAAVVHVQLRDARPLHAVASRRRRPRALGRLVAGAPGPAACRTS